MTKTQQIDFLNIFLILLSGMVSVLFPLQTFILAFFILGPLHYFTEINWLASKDYFTKGLKKSWFWICLLMSLWIMIPTVYFNFYKVDSTIKSKIFLFLNQFSNAIVLLVVSLAILIRFIKSKKQFLQYFLLIGGITFICSLLLKNTVYLIGFFIPTFIHVYVFTLLFMVFGIKKSKSKLGMLSIILALIIPIALIFLPIKEYYFSDFFKNLFLENRFYLIPQELGKQLGLLDKGSFEFYASIELKLLMFLSFSYLYHYLNWFSKTSIIKWHKNLTNKTTIIIILGYALIIAMLIINFKIGLYTALFFSFLHVFLEFPLNVESIVGLFRK